MLDSQELIADLNEGDYIQVITEHFNGGVGKLRSIHSSYLYVEPFDLLKEGAEDNPSLSISQDIIFPIEEIKLLIKVTNINAEENKNENRQTI